MKQILCIKKKLIKAYSLKIYLFNLFMLYIVFINFTWTSFTKKRTALWLYILINFIIFLIIFAFFMHRILSHFLRFVKVVLTSTNSNTCVNITNSNSKCPVLNTWEQSCQKMIPHIDCHSYGSDDQIGSNMEKQNQLPNKVQIV